MAANMLAVMPIQGTLWAFPAALVIFVAMHGINVALNLIGTFIHDARLQYLEFYGKFFEDGGKPFKPLSIKTNYVDIA
jgi:V/A-type H+-transporting ATPase subunit I